MWAVVSREPGEPVELVDVPRPGPGPGQVLIRVEAAAVNPVDLATAAGFLVDAGMMPSRQQTGLGWDVAGVLADTGDGVTRFRPGQRVIGLRDLIDVPLGTFAEYVALDAGAVAAAPDRLTSAEAATLPLNALTADQALDLRAVPGNRARDAVRNGGAFISVAPGAAPIPLRGTRLLNVWIRAHGRRLAELAALADAGLLGVRAADSYPLDKAAVAFDRLSRGGLRGRLVLIP